MKPVFAAAALAVVIVSAPAAAAATLSGKYIITQRRMCQAKAVFNFANNGTIGNYVNSVNLLGGTFDQSMLLATFSPAKGNVTLGGFGEGGDSVLFQLTGTQGSTMGSPVSEEAISGKVPYANTDNSFTFGGATYHALFGQVDKNGIAHYFTWEGVTTNDSGQLCTQQAEASRQ